MNRKTTLTLTAAFATTALATLTIGGCQSGAPAHEDHVPEAVKVDAAVSATPSAALHVAAGDLALSQENAGEAMAQYRVALSLDATNTEAMYKVATLLAFGKQFDESIAMWQRYASATKDNTAAYNNLGRTYELAGQWREAEASYVTALRRDPASTVARVNYGVLLAKRDRTDEAEAQLGKALRPSEVQYNLGSVCELKNDAVGATMRYTKALALDPQLAAARQRLDAIAPLLKVSAAQ